MIERLSQRLQERREQEGGFTLVELLVVIVILGILAAIVVFAVGGITDKGSDSATATDTAVLQSSEEAVYAQTKTTPLYINEQGLVDGKFLRSLSSKGDICLKGTVSGSPAVISHTQGTDYKVVTQLASTLTATEKDAACAAAGGTGFVFAGG